MCLLNKHDPSFICMVSVTPISLQQEHKLMKFSFLCICTSCLIDLLTELYKDSLGSMTSLTIINAVKIWQLCLRVCKFLWWHSDSSQPWCAAWSAHIAFDREADVALIVFTPERPEAWGHLQGDEEFSSTLSNTGGGGNRRQENPEWTSNELIFNRC